MHMLRALTGFFLLGLSTLAVADALPSQLELAQQYFKVAGLDKMYTDKKQIDAAIDGQIKMAEKNLAQRMPPEKLAEFHAALLKTRPSLNASVTQALAKMRPELVQVIAQNYTEQELKALVAFYSSAEGRTIVTKNPAMMSAMMGVSGKYMGPVMQDMQKNLMRALQETAATRQNAPAGK
jgi:hypothetical protein